MRCSLSRTSSAARHDEPFFNRDGTSPEPAVMAGQEGRATWGRPTRVSCCAANIDASAPSDDDAEEIQLSVDRGFAFPTEADDQLHCPHHPCPAMLHADLDVGDSLESSAPSSDCAALTDVMSPCTCHGDSTAQAETQRRLSQHRRSVTIASKLKRSALNAYMGPWPLNGTQVAQSPIQSPVLRT